MIESLTATGLPELLEVRAEPCVSLVLRTDHGPTGAEAAKLQLKNLLASARDEVSTQLRPHQTDALLQPAEDILEDEKFWHNVADGLAIYLSPGFTVVRRVPGEVHDISLVADRFAVAPILHAVLPDVAFHVLAISRNHTHVFTGDRFTLTATKVPHLPDSLDDALWYESHDNLLNHHGGSHIGSGGRTSTTHGTTSASDERKEQFDRYFRKVDDAVVAALSASAAPLVIAAIDREIAAYTALSRYRNVLAPGIEGSPDRTSIGELHAAAWAIVAEDLDRQREERSARYRELAGTGATSTDPLHIAELAATGGIETLFIARGARVWVHTGAGEPGPGDRELVNDAVTDALRNGGSVEPSDDLASLASPGGEVPTMAALLRTGRG